MGRSRSCCSKSNHGVNRGAYWTALEDKILKDYIINNGAGRWDKIPKQTGLKRGGKSCRLRWMNYLRPDIIRGNISADEEDLIVRLHKLLGNRWSLIAGRLPGRTDNEIKNYWNIILSKKVEANNCDDHSKRYSCRDLEDPIIKEPSNIDDDYPPPPSPLDENVGTSKNLIEQINIGVLEENDSSSSWEEFMIDINERQIITDDSFDKLCCDRNNIATMIENEECYVGYRNWSTSSTSSSLEESFDVRNWTSDDHSLIWFESDLHLW
ncbi:hypothetical protein LWI28_012665 [Acer negundo]|uniref:Uncharacterized protein n=1 Tax=Acer negundo TaxID=4023 RepID=A0AAD5JIQ4_ACENE|nr:hypothetical protein LWI28_012665 [Acer negundo]KAK4853636.1 hypothetical protein QYF36_011993 [Acer negundo]